MQRASALACALSLLAACAGAHESGDAGVDASVMPDAGCPQLDDVIAFQTEADRRSCERSLRCTIDSLPFSTQGYLSNACEASVPDRAGLCEQLASGQLQFDAAAAERCLDSWTQLAAEPCYQRIPVGEPTLPFLFPPSAWPWPEGCDGVLLPGPRLPNGLPADCSRLGCPSDWVCVAGAACGGTCQQATAGGDCRVVPCAHGLLCDGPAGTCGTTCNRNDECEGRFCIDARCQSPAALPDLGEPCLMTADARICGGIGTFCDAASGLCAMRRDIGEPCSTSQGPDVCRYGDCIGSVCALWASCFPGSGWEPPYGCDPAVPYCALDGSCTTDATIASCDPALAEVGLEDCPPGLRCDARTSGFDLAAPCRPEVSEGATCDATVICTDGTTCVAGRCTPWAPPGGHCGTDGLCGPWYAVALDEIECIEGVCVATFVGGSPGSVHDAIGDPCTDDNGCFQGRCTDGRCQWVPAGGACVDDWQCPSGGCVPGNTCPAYRYVADGETCDSRLLLCPDPLVCVTTDQRLPTGIVRRICRAMCPL